MATNRTCAPFLARLAALRLAARVARVAELGRSRRLRRGLRQLARAGLLPALALALAWTPLAAQSPILPVPVTDELRVHTTGSVDEPSVAMDADGDVVVAWEQAASVFYRRYSAEGVPREPPRPVGRVLTGAQLEPAVAMDADGDFVVVWSGDGASGFDTILAQRFDREGGAREEPFAVNFVTGGARGEPLVAMDADGDFVVAWEEGPDDTSSASGELYMRRFNAQGEALADQQFVAEVFDTQQADLAMNGRGDILIAWAEQADLGTDVFAARFDGASGELVAVADGEPINAQTSSNQHSPAVALDADGSFVVGWREFIRDSIDAQLFDATGARDGQPFVVSRGFADLIEFGSPPRVAYLPYGIVFAWAFDPGSDSDRDHQVVWRLFSKDGVSQSVEQIAAEVNFQEASNADISASDAGDFVVGWDNLPDQVDRDHSHIRLYRSPVSYIASADVISLVEQGAPSATFTVRRDGQIGSRSRVTYSFGGTARFGADYTIVGGTAGARTRTGSVEFAPGETAKTIVIRMVDDTISEPNKSITLELSEAQPARAATISFPVVVITLGDNDLAEVRIWQSDNSTEVVRGGRSDTITIALRTVPLAPVRIILAPSSRQLNLDAGWGAARELTFAADASALVPQEVRIFTAGTDDLEAMLSETVFVTLAASSEDPGYDQGARFTVDGADRVEIPVTLTVPDGSGPGILAVFLPLASR